MSAAPHAPAAPSTAPPSAPTSPATVASTHELWVAELRQGQELRPDPRRVRSAWEAARVRGGRLACGAGDGTAAPGDLHRPAVSHAHDTSAPWGRPLSTPAGVVRKNSGRCSWSCSPPTVTAIVTGPVTAALAPTREGRAVSACARGRGTPGTGHRRHASAAAHPARSPSSSPSRPCPGAVRLDRAWTRPRGLLDGSWRVSGGPPGRSAGQTLAPVARPGPALVPARPS